MKFRKYIDIRYWFVLFVKITGIIPVMLFLRPKYYYPDKQTKKEFKRTPCIIASNHTSFKDPFLMVSSMYFKRLSIIATKDLFRNAPLRLLFRLFMAIPIDKDSVPLSTIKKASSILKDGHSVGIFPEGTIDHDKNIIADFKSGVILISMLSNNAPIYPIYLVKRSSIIRRYRIIIGKKFDITKIDFTGLKQKEKLDKASSLLHNQELELEKFAKELKVK